MSIKKNFPCAFLMARSVCSVAISLVRIKISNRFFYRSAFVYFSPCEGFYRVSSTALFFIHPGKAAHSIHGARRRVQRHWILKGMNFPPTGALFSLSEYNDTLSLYPYATATQQQQWGVSLWNRLYSNNAWVLVVFLPPITTTRRPW